MWMEPTLELFCLLLFSGSMKGLIEKGYVYVARSPLYKIKRRKNEQYVQDDAELSKILISLGCEDVSFKKISSDKNFTPEEIQKINRAVS